MTVRALLRALYAVKAGPEWDAAAERRAFLRTLRRVRRIEQAPVPMGGTKSDEVG
jgi:hypothetical protein